MHWINITIKEVKKKLLSIIWQKNEILKEDARNNYRSLSKTKKKDKKRKYQRERYDMNTNLNEKLKQYERNY